MNNISLNLFVHFFLTYLNKFHEMKGHKNFLIYIGN